MSFESIQFVIFLPLVFAVYWACRPRYRWIVALLSSIVFYAFAGPAYLAILISVCVITYTVAGITRNHKHRWVLILGIIGNFSPLMIFKYLGFFQSNVNAVLQITGSDIYFEPVYLMLPLGISFYTFSAAAYMIDSYRGRIQGNYSFLQVIAGISFFPCLIAGPIERQEHLLPQLLEEKNFDYETAAYGLKRIAFGVFKKLVLADTLAAAVNKVFSNTHEYHGLTLLVTMFLFSLQIYCDFSGYSDMAIGIARLFGITLFENFTSPYLSRSFTEIWRKWHISLSSWFRDYIYIPLGGSRRGRIRKAVNVMVVFLVSGLWHGASWTFVIWGGLNGAAQVAENLLPGKKTENKSALMNVFRTMVVFVAFSIFWVFFRADTVGDAVYIISHMLRGIGSPDYYFGDTLTALGFTANKAVIIFLQLLILCWYDIVSLKTDPIQSISQKPLIVRWAVYIIFVLMIVLFSSKGAPAEFIYAAF